MGADDIHDEPQVTPGLDDDDLQIGSVEEILERASSDIIEKILPVPEWGVAVKVRSFTAAQSATIRTVGFQQEGEGVNINWPLMEQTQFKMGVVEPAFSEKEVRQLYMKSGRGFQRVIKWLDENSGLDKEAMKEIKETFPGSDERTEV